jgi:hypothetical protein
VLGALRWGFTLFKSSVSIALFCVFVFEKYNEGLHFDGALIYFVVGLVLPICWGFLVGV